MARSDSGESVLERAVRILDAFDGRSPSLGVGQIASRANLPLSTTSRMVQQLILNGFLRRDEDGRIGLSVLLWKLAQRASPTMELREAALPSMQNLHGLIGRQLQLSVLHEEQVVCVERTSLQRSVGSGANGTEVLSLHLFSAGLVLRAHASDAQRRLLCGRLTASAHTVPSPRDPQAHMAQVRRDGFACFPGSVRIGMKVVAVPIRGADGRVIAALSVALAQEARIRAYVAELRAAAANIRHALEASPSATRLVPQLGRK